MSKFRPTTHLEDSIEQWIFGSMPFDLKSREIDSQGFSAGMHDVFRIVKWNGWADYYTLPSPRRIAIADVLRELVTTAALNTRSSWDGQEYDDQGIARRVRLLVAAVSRLLATRLPGSPDARQQVRDAVELEMDSTQVGGDAGATPSYEDYMADIARMTQRAATGSES